MAREPSTATGDAPDGPPAGSWYGFETPEPTTGQRRTSPSGFLLDAFRRRRAGRAVLSGLTAVLFVAGAGMFAYPFFTDVYTEQIVQNRLEDEFEQIKIDHAADTDDADADWARSIKGQSGKPLTKLALPALDVETLVVEGTSPAALRAGAGHYPNTPLPGEDGNVAIAGHRTTYGRPFNRVDELVVGDDIWLSTPVGDYRYEAVAPPEDYAPVHDDPAEGPAFAGFVTAPKDWRVIAQTSEPVLTLTTCHPKGSARQRLIIRAELVESKPSGYYDNEVATAA